MPFWSKKKDLKKDSSNNPSRSSSFRSTKSHDLTGQEKLDKKDNKHDIDKSDNENKIKTPVPIASPLLEDFSKLNLNDKPTANKRISTIVENYDDYVDDTDTDSVSGSDDDDDDDDSDDDNSDEDDSGEDSFIYENHLHMIRKLPFQLKENHLKSKLQKWKLISKQQLNNLDYESSHTYSLLDEKHRIHQLSCHFNNYDSVINDPQIKLIDSLKSKIDDIISENNDHSVNLGKSLLQRYGNVTKVIGRGAYGLIKIIEPESNDSYTNQQDFVVKTSLYAVKELLKRKDEPTDKYIDRVIAEFIISSTLNNKHILKTVDLMITTPENSSHELKLCQVMECTPGGDLYTYFTTNIDLHDKPINYMAIEEMDCFLKQISKGLYYMHQHGIAHCDLKLENILITYKYDKLADTIDKAKIILKIGDFGKANVLRTKWEANNQLTSSTFGPIGSEPFMAPEEHFKNPKVNYSLIQKDNWSLGILMLVVFGLRKKYYSGSPIKPDSEERFKTQETCGYLWSCTDVKDSLGQKFKDRVFANYMKTYMIADYDSKTKDWLVKRKGSFRPIERLFVVDDDEEESNEDAQKHEVDDLSELRRMIIYKLLDPNHTTRLTIDQLMKSDWMSSVESCS